MSSSLPFQTSGSNLTFSKDLLVAKTCTNKDISLSSTNRFSDGFNEEKKSLINQTMLLRDETCDAGLDPKPLNGPLVLQGLNKSNGTTNNNETLIIQDSINGANSESRPLLNEPNLMNDTSQTSPEDSIGLSPTDSAERKLQYSLDELIEQQSCRTPNFAVQNFSQKKNKHIDRRDKFASSLDTVNSSFRLQKSNNNAGDYYRKQYQRNVRTALQRMRPCPYNVFPAVSAPSVPLGTDKYLSYAAAAPILPDSTQMIYRHVIPNGYVDNTLPPGKIFFAPTTAGSLYPSWNFPSVTAPSASVGDIALSEIEIVVPDFCATESASSGNFALIVKFKGTEVLKVRKPQGELILNSGGWRTVSTRVVLNCALKPLALWIEPALSEVTPTNSNDTHSVQMASDHEVSMSSSHPQWNITDGKSYLATFHDDMVIGQVGLKSVSSLLARASVIAQHLRQAKHTATMRRTQYRLSSRGP